MRYRHRTVAPSRLLEERAIVSPVKRGSRATKREGCEIVVAGSSVRSLTMKLDPDEKELLESVERGEWKSASGGRRERARYSRHAKATFRKDRRLNIRLSSKDLVAIQKRALAEGLPYQTLISSLLLKYASGRLKEV
jgi:predicted DNA binding CopG/RHH family protein